MGDNRGAGTSGYFEYDRKYVIRFDGKPKIRGNSALEFLGDPRKYIPEELFLASFWL